MYLVKTIRKEEHKLLRNILPQYYHHMTRPGKDGPGKPVPESLLTRIVGCHVLRLSKHSKIGADKIYFVVMTNILNTDLDITRRFDLKGSWVNRRSGVPPEHRKNSKETLKDNDFVEMGQKIRIGPERKAKIMESMRRDVQFLEQQSIIDYSLLVGIHDHSTTNGTSNRTILSTPSSSSTVDLRGSMSMESPQSDGEGENDDAFGYHDRTTTTREEPFFHESHGGMRSVDGSETYVMGLLDFLTVYNGRKRAERFGKAMLFMDKNGISVMPPHGYAKRFLDFMDKSIE